MPPSPRTGDAMTDPKPEITQEDRDAAEYAVGLRAIALFEAAKGLLVLISGSGLLLLVHRDAQAIAERFLAHMHLNPAGRYPHIFLQIATGATPGRLRLWALGAALYAILRFVEAVGLWHARRWAEWFGVATGLLYVPFEVLSFIRRPSIEAVLALTVSLGVVLFLSLRLRAHRER